MNKSTNNSIHDGNLGSATTYDSGIAQATMHRKLQKFCDDVLRPFGITKVQWLIIGTVYEHRQTGIRVSDLARIVGTNLPYMTNTVNTLEHKNILERLENQLDSRSSIIAIHPDFAPKCKKIEQTLRDALRQKIYSDISTEDFRVYMKVLYTLANK